MSERYTLKLSIIENFIKWLTQEHAEEEEGIFRISGRAVKVHKILSRAKSGKNFSKIDGITSFDVGDALKRYMRYLVDPLFPVNYYDQFIESQGDPEKIGVLLKAIPSLNRECIKSLFGFLVKVAYFFISLLDFSEKASINKMGSANIGVCFAPSVLRGKDFDLDKADMQSLINGKPLIKKEQGLWIRVTNKKTGEVYYVNKMTKESTWKVPDRFIDEEEQEFFDEEDDFDFDNLFTWQAIRSVESNEIYYFNKKTNETSWKKPQDKWNAILDPEQQDFYFYNDETHETTWKIPETFVELRRPLEEDSEANKTSISSVNIQAPPTQSSFPLLPPPSSKPLDQSSAKSTNIGAPPATTLGPPPAITLGPPPAITLGPPSVPYPTQHSIGAPPLAPPPSISPPSMSPPPSSPPPPYSESITSTYSPPPYSENDSSPLPPPPEPEEELPLPSDWYVLFDKFSNRQYYYDRNNKFTTWEKPKDFIEWKKLIEPVSKRAYYYNQITKQTTWKVPQELSGFKDLSHSEDNIPEDKPPAADFAQANIRAKTKRATKALRICSIRLSMCERANDESNSIAPELQRAYIMNPN